MQLAVENSYELFCRKFRLGILGYVIAGLISVFLTSELQASSSTQSKSSQLVSLKEVGSRFGLQFCWIKPEHKARLNSWWADLIFEVHKRDFTINGINVSLSSPVLGNNGQLYISKSDLDKTLTPILYPKSIGGPISIKTIVLDPGHGGQDNGTENKLARIKEKDLTLDLAFRLQKILQQKGYKVILTRDRDTFVPLEMRAKIANQYHADLFLSLHFNSAESKKAQGIETYALSLTGYPSTNQTQKSSSDNCCYAGNQQDLNNILLSYSLHKTLVQDTGAMDRSLRRARFAVLRDLQCPGALIESGYLSNEEEMKRVCSPSYRQQLAQSIAKGVENYLGACHK